MQDEVESKIKELKKYKPKIQERKDLLRIILDNGQKLFERREVIIEVFRKYIFRFLDSESESESDSIKSEQSFEESKGKRVKLKRRKSDELNKMITKNGKTINKELFREHFQFQSLYDMQESLSKT